VANPFSAFLAETSPAHASGVRPRAEWSGFLHKGRAGPAGAGCSEQCARAGLGINPSVVLMFQRERGRNRGRPILRRPSSMTIDDLVRREFATQRGARAGGETSSETKAAIADYPRSRRKRSPLDDS
jgi:hypothetical protein